MLDGLDTVDWSGEVAALDGDGYVHLCVRQGTSGGPQLFVVGGSGYGTYFGVAAFLRRWLRAVWIYPGEHGEVIPRAGTAGLTLSPAPNVLEEPTLRSRSFGLMVEPPILSDMDVAYDDARTWLLRNRLRPTSERYYVFTVVNDRRRMDTDPLCPPGAARAAFVLAMQQTEERIPSGHNLPVVLSPVLPSMATGVDTGRVRHETHPQFFPDLRPRQYPTTLEPPGVRAVDPTTGISPVLGTTMEVSLITGPLPCDRGPSCCPVFAPVLHWSDFNAWSGEATTVIPYPTGSAASRPGNALLAPLLGRNRFAWMIRDVSARPLLLQRYIPQSVRHGHQGRGVPLTEWHPCIFQVDRRLTPGFVQESSGTLGQPATVHPDLALDIALQVRIATGARAMNDGERAFSLAFGDGSAWCQCPACVQVDDLAGAGSAQWMYQRQYIGSVVPLRTEALEAAGATGDMTIAALGRRTGSSVPWAMAPGLNPFANMDLDALAAHGVVVNAGYLPLKTRRGLYLWNAVARELARLDAMAPPAADELVLAFLVYAETMAPPMTGLDQESITAEGRTYTTRGFGRLYGEGCERPLMPFLTGTRDTLEYAASEQFRPDDLRSPRGSLARMMRAPDQFNHLRWASMARQVAFYEYHYGAYHLVPALYSTRMQNALSKGTNNLRLRGYVSEVQPNWGLQAPMLWELAQMLYTPSERVAELRGEFSAAAFGPAAGAMTRYFNLCEAAWGATRDRWPVYDTSGATRFIADRRERSVSGAFDGGAMAGRLGYLSQFDGWHEETMVAGRGLRSRLLQCWDALSEALVAARGAGATERTRYVERVQVFRQSFGLTLLVALWSRPLRQAFEVVRAHAGNRALLRQVNTMVEAAERGAPVRVVQATETEAKASFATSGLGLQKATLPGALRAEVDACLGTERVPGLRPLRNQVNRFLSSGGITVNAGNSASTFPTLWAHRAALGEATLTELGLGLFPGAGPLADNAPIPVVPPTGLHRVLGLHLPSVINYANWWRTTAGLDEVRRRDAIRRGDGDGQGLGWIFKAAREVAQAVVLYGVGYPNGDPSTIMRSGMDPVTVAAAAIEPYAVRIMEG